MADGHATAEAHSESTRKYWIIGAVLAVITIIEVLITFVPMPHEFLFVILMILAFVKGAGVVMYFMHLQGDFKVFQFVFIVPFSLASLLILLFILLFSTHDGRAG